MSAVRRRLSWVVGIWLASQVAGVVAAPIAFCCRTTAVAEDDACCPGLLPGQICPMHHTREGGRDCKMRDACGRADAGLVSLAGIIGLLPAAPPAPGAFAVGDPIAAAPSTAIARASHPESPPPRG